MLLRVIDRVNEQREVEGHPTKAPSDLPNPTENSLIEIRLELQDEEREKEKIDYSEKDPPKIQQTTSTLSYETHFLMPSISQNFRSSLSWYFARYLQEGGQEGDSDIVGRLISIGQSMGDRLAGEGNEFIKIKEAIEKKGYEHLRVQIEISCMMFNQECWESLILPDSKYILSSVVKGFVRQFRSNKEEGEENNHVEKDYQLSKDSPLNILHLISRPHDWDLSKTSSQGFNNSVNAVQFDGALCYELFSKPGFGALYKRLSKGEKTVHVLHFDGPIEIKNGIPYLLFETGEATTEIVSVSDLTILLISNNVTLLVIEAQQYLLEGKTITADLGLAYVAKAAMERGMGNILGLSHLTNPWIASQCFEAVYKQLIAGFSIEQAVVEARKTLQSSVETTLFSGKPKPFHVWSLLAHYANQSVQFFTSPLHPVELHESGFYQEIRKNLFGFHSELLPPQVFNCIEKSSLMVLEACQPGSHIYLSGPSGSGKTQISHQIGFYLQQHQQVKFSFYFDYDHVFYTLTDILQMIAPVMDLSVDQFEGIKKAINAHCCYFVFDNLDQARYRWSNGVDGPPQGGHSSTDITEEQKVELIDFLDHLKEEGHIILMTGQSGECCLESGFEIPIQPMVQLEQQVLSSEVLRGGGLPLTHLEDKDEDNHFSELLEALHGSPFLIRKVLPSLAKISIEELTKQVKEVFKKTRPESITKTFYTWQFDELSETRQRLLLVLLDIPEVLLEMIGIVCNQKEPFAPANQLFTLLDDPEIDFSKALEAFDRAGFLQSYPHGRVLNPQPLSFLQTKLEADSFLAEHKDTLHLLLSQMVCEGLNLIFPNLQQQQNPAIKYNILMNRQRWVKHFERLWFAEKYMGFMQAKRGLTRLMQQERLGGEMATWSLDLIKRSDMNILLKNGQLQGDHQEASFACLFVAQDALGSEKAEQEPTVIKIAEQSQQWLDELKADHHPSEKYKENLALFNYVIRFLDTFYRKRSAWEALQEISETARKVYEDQEAWPLVIQSLSALAQCSFELGETEKGLEFERQILEDLPFDKLPPHMKAQLTKEIILARDIRSDTVNTQRLLNKYVQLPEAENDIPFIKNVQAEIYLKDQRYEEATKIYYQLFCEMAQPELQNTLTEQIENKLKYLEEKLGVDVYKDICSKVDAESA